jgi:hypothetical protein
MAPMGVFERASEFREIFFAVLALAEFFSDRAHLFP